jgi:heme exporter protein D
MNLGQHANFIVGAYAIAAAVVVLLIGWVIVDHRRQRAILRDLEARGVTRRSARPVAGLS